MLRDKPGQKNKENRWKTRVFSTTPLMDVHKTNPAIKAEEKFLSNKNKTSFY
jgi:hypothetical protein